MKPRSPACAQAAGAQAADSAPSPAATATRPGIAIDSERASPAPVPGRTSQLRIRTFAPNTGCSIRISRAVVGRSRYAVELSQSNRTSGAAPSEAAPPTDEACTAPLVGASLPGALYPSQPRSFMQETTFGNLAHLSRPRRLKESRTDRTRSKSPDVSRTPTRRTGSGVVPLVHNAGLEIRLNRNGPRRSRRLESKAGSPESVQRAGRGRWGHENGQILILDRGDEPCHVCLSRSSCRTPVLQRVAVLGCALHDRSEHSSAGCAARRTEPGPTGPQHPPLNSGTKRS